MTEEDNKKRIFVEKGHEYKYTLSVQCNAGWKQGEQVSLAASIF